MLLLVIMTGAFHPENILPDGPTNLDPTSIIDELASDRYAVTFSVGVIALSGVLGISAIGPDFAEAVQHSDVVNAVSNGIVAGFLASLMVISARNIRAYGQRWTQARYNQRLNEIAAANNMQGNL